jgi:hypothetical protein
MVAGGSHRDLGTTFVFTHGVILLIVVPMGYP